MNEPIESAEVQSGATSPTSPGPSAVQAYVRIAVQSVLLLAAFALIASFGWLTVRCGGDLVNAAVLTGLRAGGTLFLMFDYLPFALFGILTWLAVVEIIRRSVPWRLRLIHLGPAAVAVYLLALLIASFGPSDPMCFVY